MLTDVELMDLHIRALFTHNAESRLLCVNEPDSPLAPAPRMFFGRTHAGNIFRFRDDLPGGLAEELSMLCTDEPPVVDNFNVPPVHLKKYLQLLETHMPVKGIEMGPAYHFAKNITPPSATLLAVTENNAGVLHGGFQAMVAELAAWQPFVALIEQGRAVSICRSVRITPEAHEAGVETLPEHRGRGHARDVVAGWARLVLAAGAMPLYSTSWKNTSSQAVTQKLGMRCFGTDFHAT